MNYTQITSSDKLLIAGGISGNKLILPIKHDVIGILYHKATVQH